jgi:hypothetical protein
LDLRAPLDTFPPGAYTVRAFGPGQPPFEVPFTVQSPPTRPPYSRVEIVAGDRQIIRAGGRLAPLSVRVLDETDQPIAGLRLAIVPAVEVGSPLRIDPFGFIGFNVDRTLAGCCWGIMKPPLRPSELATADAHGVVTVQPLPYGFAPGSMLFGVVPYPNMGDAQPRYFSFVVTEATAPSTARVVVEFLHEPSGNYFITAHDDEIAQLDAGRFSGWRRSIGSFIALAGGADAPSGTVPVCRFFSPQFTSHFYTANAEECDTVAARRPDVWQLETRSAFRIFVPDSTGTCPADTRPVYRLFNNKAAVNHRYVTDRKLRDAMMAAGWTQEGTGPDSVAMCTPK